MRLVIPPARHKRTKGPEGLDGGLGGRLGPWTWYIVVAEGIRDGTAVGVCRLDRAGLSRPLPHVAASVFVCLSTRPVPDGLSNQKGMLRRQGGHDQGPDCHGPLGIAPHPAA